MLITNCPSAAARCLTTSYLLNHAFIPLCGRRGKASIPIIALNLDSSSSKANLVCNPVMVYDTGSTCCPFIIPPRMISCGVIVLPNYLADPLSLIIIAAAC